MAFSKPVVLLFIGLNYTKILEPFFVFIFHQNLRISAEILSFLFLQLSSANFPEIFHFLSRFSLNRPIFVDFFVRLSGGNDSLKTEDYFKPN